MQEAEKTAINSWLDLRYVVDNDRFADYFRRILIRDYGRYRELLRIEPHVSKYDWLVQQYQEAQTYSKGVNSMTANGQTTTAQNGSKTRQGTDTRTGTVSDIGSIQRAGSGTKTDVMTDSDLTTNAGADVSQVTGRDTTTGQNANTSGGSDRRDTSAHNNTKNLAKDNPMSVSYPDGIAIDGAVYQGILNWQNPTGQSEADTRNTDNEVTQYGRTESGTNSSTADHTSTNTFTHGHTISNQGTKNDTQTDVHEDSETKTNNRAINDVLDKEETETTQGTGTTTTGNASAGNTQSLTQHINTGRSIDTATLLTQASAFIKETSAMQWLISRLEPCFMGVYNDDDEFCF